jgi:hypothetical protein
MHFLLTTDLSPIFIREHLNDPSVMRDISAKMDSIVCAQLPATVWNATQDHNPRDDRWKLHVEPTFEPGDDEYKKAFDRVKQRAYAVAISCNCHRTHCATCRKGDVGKYKCRLAYPRACFNQETTMLQIVLVKDPLSGKMIPKAVVEMDSEKPEDDLLLKWRDDRIIILEVQRPGLNPNELHGQQQIANEKTLYWVDIAQSDNGCVVIFSPTLTASLACNVNAESLGNLAQAKSATFCLMPSKDMPLNHFRFRLDGLPNQGRQQGGEYCFAFESGIS